MSENSRTIWRELRCEDFIKEIYTSRSHWKVNQLIQRSLLEITGMIMEIFTSHMNGNDCQTMSAICLASLCRFIGN